MSKGRAVVDMADLAATHRRGGDAAESYALTREVWLAACGIVADHEGLRMTDLSHVDTSARRAKAHERVGRKLSCYLAVVAGEVTQHALARVSGLDRATIRAHLAAIEEMRDGDAQAELVVRVLEAELGLRLARRAMRDRALARAASEEPGGVAARAVAAVADPAALAAWRAVERAESAAAAMKTWMQTDWDAVAAEPGAAEEAA